MVVVCSSCYIEIAQTVWLRNNRKLFLTAIEAGSLRPRCQHGHVFLCPHTVEGAGELSRASLIRAQIPFPRAPPQNLISSQRPHLLIQSSGWGMGGISTIESGRNSNIGAIAATLRHPSYHLAQGGHSQVLLEAFPSWGYGVRQAKVWGRRQERVAQRRAWL